MVLRSLSSQEYLLQHRRPCMDPWLTNSIFTWERALGLWPTILCEVGLNPTQKTLVLLRTWLCYVCALHLVGLRRARRASRIPGKGSTTTKPHPQLSFPFLIGQIRPGVCCFKKARHKTLELTPIQTNCAITKRIPGFTLRFTAGLL